LDLDIRVVGCVKNFDTIVELLAYIAPLENLEGVVIAFADGERHKIKADQYVRIHRVKDKIRSFRHILNLVLANEMDDVIPHLDSVDLDRVNAFTLQYFAERQNKIVNLTAIAVDAMSASGGDKRKIAVEVLPKLHIKKENHRFIFGYADGKDMKSMIDGAVTKALGSNTKFDDMWQWLTDPTV
jgi:hypothetical protein